MRRTRIRPVSSRRRKRDAVYQQRRVEAFDRAGGWCMVAAPGCRLDAQQVHHIAGRGGPDPHRLDNLLPVCGPCHDRVHAEPAWAREQGWMQSRHGRAADV